MAEPPGRVPPPDPALVERAKLRTSEGTAAFTQLLEMYQTPVLNYLARFTQNKEEAEQLTFDVFFRAWRGLPTKNPEAPFVAWLFTIAHHVAIGWLPQQQERQRTSSLDDPSHADILAPEDIPEVIGQRELIKQALDCLKPIDRSILLLRFVYGFTSDEIAKIVEHTPRLTPDNVRQRLLRACEKFRRVCDPALTEGRRLRT